MFAPGTRISRKSPIWVIDVGCGIGYTARWLDIVGMDLDSALIREASRLAIAERRSSSGADPRRPRWNLEQLACRDPALGSVVFSLMLGLEYTLNVDAARRQSRELDSIWQMTGPEPIPSSRLAVTRE